MEDNKDVILEVKDLCKYFFVKKGLFKGYSYVKVVDRILFIIKKGEILGLVGELGCGKIIIGRIILKFYELISG